MTLSTGERLFVPYRRAASDTLKELVNQAIADCLQVEANLGLRKRARKPAPMETFKQTVEAVLCDTLHAVSHDPPQRLIVSLTKQSHLSRYRSAIETAAFSPTLSLMAEAGWIEYAKGLKAEFIPKDDQARETRDRKTRVSAGPKLLERKVRLGGADTTCRDCGELIILKRTRSDYWDAGGVLPYRDTSITLAMRAQMECLNEWLRSFELSAPGMDAADRTMRRVFNNGSFEEGGRLFGGFWQNCSKADRKLIRIDGSTTATLDYAQMFPRLLYGRVQVMPPPGDLYALPSFGPGTREGFKKLFNALVFDGKTERQRLPKSVRQHFPKQLSATELIQALRDFHQPIANYLPSAVGFELFFSESEVILEVLERSRERHVAALPIHDAVLCKIEDAEPMRAIMEGVFKDAIGVPCTVTVTANSPSLLTPPPPVSLQGQLRPQT